MQHHQKKKEIGIRTRIFKNSIIKVDQTTSS